MRCKMCGTEYKEGMLYCTGCGAPLERKEDNGTAGAAWQPAGGNTYVPPGYVAGGPEMVSEEYKPITMWGYFGYELLFAIPVVGLILILVFSFGGTRNKNLRNFARSYFCFGIVMAILVFLIISYTGMLITRW